MVELLLKRGVATNLLGDQPWARRWHGRPGTGRGDIVELLKQHGAT
jgi:hypothetical protein